MKVKIVGAYLPRLDPRFIAAAAALEESRFRSTNLELIESGVSTATPAEVEARAPEFAEEVAYGLRNAALFEAEVTGSREEFDGRCFFSPEIDRYGWCPTYLDTAGLDTVTEEDATTTYEQDFRVLFYIDDWNNHCTLEGPTGQLELPALSPVPQRLWRVTAYQPLD